MRVATREKTTKMDTRSRKNRTAFRPTLGEIRLEERVVLNGATTAAQVAAFQTRAAARAQAHADLATLRQARITANQHLRAASRATRAFVQNQITALYADPNNLDFRGRPTTAALANLKANIHGALDATALQLSTQASLLPGSTNLVGGLQNSLLGAQRNSLTSRLDRLIDSGRVTRSPAAFRRMMDLTTHQTFARDLVQLNRFLVTTPFRRLSVDPTTGQRVPLSQFMANQAVNQINNTFGLLANSVGANARTALFDPAGNFNPQGVSAFQQQYNSALGTAAFQVGNILSAFPNAQTTLGSGLQSSIFGTGTNAATGQPITSLANSLSGVLPTGTGTTTGGTPLTLGAFNTGFQNAFTSAYQNFTTPINTFLGVTPTTGTVGNYQLPTGFFQPGATFPSLFGPQFNTSTFNSGFNNGFATTGMGFPGFGTTPTGFSAGFGTGFNSFINTANQGFGLTTTGGTTGLLGTGLTTGVGTTTGTGLATGTATTGLGTVPTTTGLGSGTQTTNTSFGLGSGLLGTGGTLI
jgi:hypothetical protein